MDSAFNRETIFWNDEQLQIGKIDNENDSAESETELDASNNENVEEGFGLTANTNDFFKS